MIHSPILPCLVHNAPPVEMRGRCHGGMLQAHFIFGCKGSLSSDVEDALLSE